MGTFDTAWADLPSETTPITSAWLAAIDKETRKHLLGIDVVEDHGAKVDGVTDDTAAWQAAIDAAAASGSGRIYSSKRGVSIIAGPLQDTAGANAQLVLPSVESLVAPGKTLVIEGPEPAQPVYSVIGTIPLPAAGLVLKSTLTTGSGGAMIGGKAPAGATYPFSNVHLVLRNLGLRMPTNPLHTALDARKIVSLDMDNVMVDNGSYTIGASQPTITTSYGLRTPGNNNGAFTRLGAVGVVGFYTGYEFGEHAVGQQVVAAGCVVAATFTAANHASHFRRFMAVHCTRGITFTGTHYVDIDQYDIERATSGWSATTADIDDASNYGHGTIWWHVVKAGVGIDATFTKTGGASLNTYRVGTAMGGGGGSTVYVGRDRLVAVAGDDTLALGASPVAGSPLIWVNNVIKWPGTDYTVSGSDLTFGAALSAGDVVLVKYETLTTSPPASILHGPASVNIVDDFNRANSASSLGSTSVGGKAWTAEVGTWGIAASKAYLVSAPGAVGHATVDSGVSDCTVGATLDDNGNSTYAGLVARSDGAGNYYLTEVQTQLAYTPKIYKVVAGTMAAIATGASITVAPGTPVTLVLSGSSITFKVNGATVVTATDSAFVTNTRHGIYLNNSGTGRIDDFSIQP